MSRRSQRPELEFGSDSFLDVVCNIVGILIILIVIVAVQLERQPVSSDSADQTSSNDAALRYAEQQNQLQQRSREQEVLRRQLEDLQRNSAALSGQLAATGSLKESLKAQISDAENAVRSQDQKQQKSKRARSRLQKEQDALKSRIATLQDASARTSAQFADLEDALTHANEELDEATRKIRTASVETQQLTEVLNQAEARTAPADRLEHRLSPVTRPVEADERHFRLSEGRISRIPVDELLERLKAQVLARRATIMRFNTFEGTVGPVDGYTMKYTVEKEGSSTLESLQTGDGRTRVSVSRWEIIPDVSLIEEPVADAVRPGSAFRTAMETSVPDSVVTIWVYEDSFRDFAAIREVANGLQLRVAARPLPAGTPIVGSPNGSRSNAQ